MQLTDVRDLCIQCEGVGVNSDGSGHAADHIMLKVSSLTARILRE